MPTIGTIWVQSYKGNAADLKKSKNQVLYFQRELGLPLGFELGDDAATDVELEEAGLNSATPLGNDLNRVEKVDLVYFSGHGSSVGPRFGGLTSDDGTARNTEVKWGNGNVLKWVVLDCCFALHTASTASPTGADTITRWRGAFAGVHQIFGFRTQCADEQSRGAAFAEHMREGTSVRQAWINACEESEPGTTRWALLRAPNVKDERMPFTSATTVLTPTAGTVVYETGPC